MSPMIVEGVYENGRITLTKKPQGMGRARVTVTFYPETETLELTRPISTEPYPAELREEYKTLIQKKLHRTLTEEEATRLEAVRAEINQRDRESESWSDWERRAQEVEQNLTAIRRELEALPDA